jgi:hypothetical protein
MITEARTEFCVSDPVSHFRARSSKAGHGNRDANRTRARIVSKGVFRSVSRCCYAKHSELSPWPVERSADWTARVNAPLSTTQRNRVRASIGRGQQYGEEK